MSRHRIGSLCSGYGGLDMAVAAYFDAATAWFVEYDDAPSKILAHHYPDVPNYGDISLCDWSSMPPVTIISAGFPCQDVSAAGKQAGLKHGTRTGLWHHVVQAIDGLRPEWVVLENVPGLFTADGDEWPDHLHALHDEWQRWVRIERLIDAKLAKATRKGRDNGEWHTRKQVERVRAVRRRKRAVARFRAERYRSVPRAIATVLGSLAALGYDAQWHCISAAEVGACHKRERVFILARDAAADTRDDRLERGQELYGEPVAGFAGVDGRHPDGHADASRAHRAVPADKAGRAAADASGDGRAEGQGEQVADDDGSGGERAGESVGTDRRPVHRVAPDLLLPTPMAHPSGNSPENHLRKKPGRKRVTDLSILVENGLIETGGVPLLPTPAANLGEHSRDIGADPETRRANNHHVSTADVVCYLPTPRASTRGDAPSEHARHQPDLNAITFYTPKWGEYEPAIRRAEQVVGRPAPSPTEPSRTGTARLSARFAEWMQMLPDRWVTDPAIDISQADRLKAIGNGVCPVQAYAALDWLVPVALAA